MTHYSGSGRPITTTQVITLTTSLGSVTPTTTTLVDGRAQAVFSAGLQPGLATIYATNGEITGTLEIAVETTGPLPPVPDHARAYLPVTLMTATPDLAVKAISATNYGVTVVVQNTGQRSTAGPFWVDAFISPNPVPTAANQPWRDLAGQGLAWRVTRLLQPGESLTLTVGDAYYQADMSQVTWPLNFDTLVYVQADRCAPL